MLGYSAIGWRKPCLRPVSLIEGKLIILWGTPCVLIGPTCLAGYKFPAHERPDRVSKYIVKSSNACSGSSKTRLLKRSQLS